MARERPTDIEDTEANTLAPIHFFVATDPWTYEPRRHNPTLNAEGIPITGMSRSDLEFWCEIAEPHTSYEWDGTPITTGGYFDLAGRAIQEPLVLLYLNPSAGYATLQEAEVVAQRTCEMYDIPSEDIVFLMRPATEIQPHLRFSSHLAQWRVAHGRRFDDKDDAGFFAKVMAREP